MTPGATRRVMVVNDDRGQLEQAGRVIEQAGFECVLCERGEEALRMLWGGETPDVVVTSLHMPGVDGWQLCRLLRSPGFPDARRRPVLVLSAAFSGAVPEGIARRIGAHGALPIPYNPSQLTAALQELVKDQVETPSCRVLIVANAETRYGKLAQDLGGYGFEAFEAQDAQSALDESGARCPDVLFLGSGLSEGIAQEFLPALRSQGCDPLVIVATSNSSPDQCPYPLGLGADAFMHEPVDAGCLVDQVTDALRKRMLVSLETGLAERTRKLRTSEACLEATVEDQTELMFRAAADGTMTHANEACCRAFGRGADELVGSNAAQLVLEEDRKRVQEHLASLTPRNPRATVQHRIVDAKRETRWLQRTDRAVFDGQSRLAEYQSVAQDVTERKRAEEALQRSLTQITQAKREWETTADSLPQLVCLLDSEGRIIRANRTIEHWNLGRVEDVKRRDLHQLLHPECTDEGCHLRTLWSGAWERVQEGGTEEYEAEDPVLRRHLGVQMRPISGHKPQDAEARGSFAVLTIEDITDRKRAEETLEEERALLARRVDERTAELRSANVELARAARLKDEFLASMSHEFRTPLNTILGMSEALQEEVYGPCNDRQRESLRSVEESGRHLLSLINDILDLAKIGAGRSEIELRSVNAQSVCQASLRLISEEANRKRLTVSSTYDSGVNTLLADERRLKQILTNLLSNAVKFTREGGRIGLDVEGDPERKTVQFTVWDTGIGISSGDMGQLFRPFVQLDSKLSRQYPGTGLGLSLVHRLVELHQGGIKVESEVGRGSRFSVFLPWQEGDECGAAVEHTERAQPGPATLCRALIIEDPRTASAHLVSYLEDMGAEVASHPTGRDATAQAAETQPDVILLGVRLADGNGWDVLKELKNRPDTQAIPVLLVSDVDEGRRALGSGATGCLTNPLSRRKLERALRQAFSTRKGEADVQAEKSSAPEGRGGGQPLILLAEDNEDNINTISDYLTAKGHRVVVARNGSDAVELAQEENPDLILMDIQMPGMDGLEATRRIRTQPVLSDVPIIALTALAMPGDRERCIAAGANEYMSKPVHLKGLLGAIEEQLSGTQARGSA